MTENDIQYFFYPDEIEDEDEDIADEVYCDICGYIIDGECECFGKDEDEE